MYQLHLGTYILHFWCIFNCHFFSNKRHHYLKLYFFSMYLTTAFIIVLLWFLTIILKCFNTLCKINFTTQKLYHTCIFFLGSTRLPEFSISFNLQHGFKFVESRRNKSRIHVRKIILSVPKLCSNSWFIWQWVFIFHCSDFINV